MVLSSHGNGGSVLGSKVNSHSSVHNNHQQPRASKSTAVYVFEKVFAFAFGLFNLLLFFFLALTHGSFFQKLSEKEKNDLAIGMIAKRKSTTMPDHAPARDRYWNLSKEPIPGFHHEFFKARGGFQLHYICNQQALLKGKDLIIFIHGFPNTCMTWRYLLQEPVLPTSNATLVAVDLPGYGGSDSLPKSDTQVLEILAEFIVAMREKYGTDGDSIGNTFVVGHDWGCVLGMRLAAEAPSLADRFILFNGPLPELVKANVERSLQSSRRIFKQFQVSPRTNFGCLSKSFQAIKPLLQQLRCSGYIFAFQLPSIFVKTLGQGGNQFFLRSCHKAEYTSSYSDYSRAESMAANLGPSSTECETETEGALKYNSSVVQRSKSIGDVFWHTTSYYRHGLALDPWEKSIETIAALYNLESDFSSSNSPARRRSSSGTSNLFNEHINNGLRAPATILWGENDIALTKAICLDGVGDYLGKESEAIVLPGFGHWLQVDKTSRKTLAQIIAMFANGNSTQTPSYIVEAVKKIDSRALLVAKR